jgi:hypothetical protein
VGDSRGILGKVIVDHEMSSITHIIPENSRLENVIAKNLTNDHKFSTDLTPSECVRATKCGAS